MKNHLVSKRITDKNGVASTRWVKADQQGVATTSAIPAPAPVAVTEEPIPADPETIEQAAVAYVNQVTYEEDDDEYVESTLATTIDDFGTFPAVLVDEINQPASDPYQKMWGLKNMMDLGKPLDSIRDHLNLTEIIAREGFEDEAAPEGTLYDFGGAYSGLEPIALNEVYPERRKKQLEGLVSATSLILDLIVEDNCNEHALNKAENGVPTIADERLRDLFVNRPEDSGVILEFMRERRTADYDRVMEILNTQAPAVASGTL